MRAEQLIGRAGRGLAVCVGLVVLVASATTAFAAKRHFQGTVRHGGGEVSFVTQFKHHKTKSISQIQFTGVPMTCGTTTFPNAPSYVGSFTVRKEKVSFTVNFSPNPETDKVTASFRKKGREATGTIRQTTPVVSPAGRCDTGSVGHTLGPLSWKARVAR